MVCGTCSPVFAREGEAIVEDSPKDIDRISRQVWPLVRHVVALMLSRGLGAGVGQGRRVYVSM